MSVVSSTTALVVYPMIDIKSWDDIENASLRTKSNFGISRVATETNGYGSVTSESSEFLITEVKYL